jgi:hypothetical protein
MQTWPQKPAGVKQAGAEGRHGEILRMFTSIVTESSKLYWRVRSRF